MFDADRPITNSTQDKLNRTLFAKYLARCILDHKDPHSLVIGLYGGWGVGKTSIIHLTVEELNAAASNLLDNEKPIILHFNPWSYAGGGQLIYHFFHHLSSTLSNASHLNNGEQIIRLLELYTLDSGRDLIQIKLELDSLLGQLNQKIIIIIDNISYLNDDEVKLMFQIVKSMGNFENTAYLLAFDKEYIISKLNRIEHGYGEQLIEKTVQLPFDVPPILQQDLEAVFIDKMKIIINQLPEDAWNIEYWAEIYYSTLRYFFDNCRDVSRYINVLNFSYSRVRDVVNPIDFFSLTAIEIFAPDVYEGIRDNKDLFTDLLENVYLLDQHQIIADKQRCDEIISRTRRIPREIILNLIMHLFPRIRRIYNPSIDLYHSGTTARKMKRICSPDLFDAYFRLSIQTGVIQPDEFKIILNLASDNIAFEQTLTRLNQDERILKFLDQLDSHIIHTIPFNHFQAIISGLLENGDLFPHGIGGLLTLDTPMRIHRIIHALLKRVVNTEERFVLLQNGITSASKSIYTLVYEMREQGREHIEESDTFVPEEYRDISPAQLQILRKLTVDKIQYWAVHGSLSDHPQLLPILRAWLDWGNKNDCKQFVKKLTDTDKGLVIFLVQTLAKAITQTMNQYQKDPAWLSFLNDIDDFIPSDDLESHARLLFEDEHFEKLREREQLALMIFLDLIKSNANKIIPKTTV